MKRVFNVDLYRSSVDRVWTISVYFFKWEVARFLIIQELDSPSIVIEPVEL